MSTIQLAAARAVTVSAPPNRFHLSVGMTAAEIIGR
jgi:hypothetical protein